MKKRLIKCKCLYIAFVIVMLVNAGCKNQGKIYNQIEIKNKLLKKYVVEKDWKKMIIDELSFKKSMNNEEHYIVMPADMTLQNNEYIIIADNNIHKIFKYNIDGDYIGMYGRPGQAPGELYYPNRIIGTEGKIYIQDGRGLNIYDKSFKYEKRILSFGSMQNIYVNNDDKQIFVNSLNKNEEQETLIEKYNEEGIVQRKFGKRFMRENQNSYDSRCYLTGDDKEIVAAFYSHPIIRRYTQEGKVIGEFRINNEILRKMEKYNYDKKFTNPAPNMLNLPLLIAGAKMYEDHIYILLYLTRLEILEYERDGVLINHYYNSEINDVYAIKGFCVSSKNKKSIFYILCAREEDHLYNVIKAYPPD